MLTISLNETILDHVKMLCSNVNYGQRGNADGNIRQQMIGLAGQCHVMDLLGMDLPEITYKHDGGVDIIHNELTIDIKTMERKVIPQPDYVNNVIGLQSHYDTDAYIFCSLNPHQKNMTICGWIHKQEFLDNATFTAKGEKRHRKDGTFFETKADLYEIANMMLNHINTAKDLRDINRE
jgi:hypothetical protein